MVDDISTAFRLPPTSLISRLGAPAAAHQDEHAAHPDGDGADREHQRELGAGEGGGRWALVGEEAVEGAGVEEGVEDWVTTVGVVDTAVVGVTVVGWVQGP